MQRPFISFSIRKSNAEESICYAAYNISWRSRRWPFVWRRTFGFLFSRNPASLTTSLLGAAVLAMAACSLKVWRSGLSSLPFMIGQAALAGALVVKHFGFFSLTKKIFPSGLYIFLSVGMLCFYSYVLLSGGNPPPKKKLAAAQPSQDQT
ncbi:hypothetical protein HPP92_026704 [Vanilla planifolia]|uniref:Uncharacterized protein n=1 Tax=Vanilla planifolia TaxID=51239 RepID=A0A835PEH3_VANPL|nr:hypothetical protein HPP92_026704 [Vanilla planifolia]